MATEKKQKKERKDPNKIDVILRLNKGDGLIFDVIDKCDEGKSKTDLIKNALFYYILHIQNGMAIDKNYPYNMVDEIHVEGLNRYLPITNSFVDLNKYPKDYDEDESYDNDTDDDIDDENEFDNFDEDEYDEDNFDIE